MGVSVSNLVEVDLRAAGIDHVDRRLRQGTGLCRKLLRLELASGRAFAPVPAHTTLDRAKSFDAGGLMPERDAIAWLGGYLQKLWATDPAGVLVFQDTWASPDDPPVPIAPQSRFITSENIYYFVEKNMVARDLEHTWRAITSFAWIGIFTRARARLIPGARVGDDIIEELARSTHAIFVEAYDREGLVVWER